MTMEEIIAMIRADHGLGREIDNLQPRYRPERGAVRSLIGALMGIVYPGVWGGDVEEELMQVRKMLERLLPGEPEGVVLDFLEAIPSVRAVAQTDVEAFYAGDPAASCIDEILCCYPGLFAVTVYRLAHVLHRLGATMLPRIMTEQAHSITGIDIHPGATVGESFFIDHGTGIVIGETTVVGDHVKLYQGVTLGALTTRGGQSLRGKKRHPTIEDNVTIYAGASILGGSTVIGRDSVIGSNVFITHSVPPCTTVTVKSQELQLRPRQCRGCPKAEAFWEE